MKAIVQDRYGSPDDLELREIDRPAIGDDEVLVRVHATSVHPDVWHMIRGEPYALRLMGAGLRRPKHRVPGSDVAGTIESVGTNVTRFRPGDEVFGATFTGNLWCNGGTYAEYVAVGADCLESKPAAITFEQAAAVPISGSIALQGLREEGRIRYGQKVLINGAGGGVGTFAVQIAKAYGAHVTGIDSAGKLNTIGSIGADRVADYMKEDFTRTGEYYDLILDIAGNHPWSECKRALTPDGTYVLSGADHFGREGRRWFGSLGRFLKLAVMSPFVRQLPGLRGARDPGDRPVVLKELVEAGKLTPVVDRTFPLSDVSEAIRYLETGQARGRIVIAV